MRRSSRLALAGALALATLAGGCSPKGVLRPNLPPETTLFVQGPVDTVNHIVHLYWFGSDPDGDVVGFEIRFHNPQAPADTGWVFTTRTDSIFTVFTGDTTAIRPRFEVRAIDNAQQRDETPAVEDFTFSNLPPRLQFTIAPVPSDVTFYTLTLRWTPIDPDGDASKMTYRLWLNGNSANVRLLPAGTTDFTIPSADFTQGDSATGAPTDTIVPRIVYVQPIDDGGLAGPVSLASWRVRKPVRGTEARLLIIDDMPNDEAGAITTDNFYGNNIRINLPAGTYSTLRLETSQPFRSAKDLEQTCKLFQAVMWYRGSQTRTFSSKTPAGDVALLSNYSSGLGAYLDGGGRLLLEGTNLVAQGIANGALSQQFLSDHLGSDFLYQHFFTAADSTAAWGTTQGVGGTTLSTDVVADSLRFTSLVGGLRAFALRDPSQGLFWAAPGALAENNAFPMAVAISVPHPNQGRAVAITFPMNRADGLGAAARVFQRILQNQLRVSP